MARVDYERGAGAYRAGRTLPAPILERWREAVIGLGLPSGGTVLDVGAGTGQFLEPLAEWLDARVVGLEPSPAMRAEGQEAGLGPYLAAVAEQLPIAAATMNGAWLSTVVHQFTDPDRAAAELRRVVRPGGFVLVRGFFSDMAFTGVLALFPGIDRSAATFPSTVGVAARFADNGFPAHEIVDVRERWELDLDAWVTRARSLRSTDSAFRPLTDDEFDAGVAAVVDQHHESGRIVTESTLRLLVLR